MRIGTLVRCLPLSNNPLMLHRYSEVGKTTNHLFKIDLNTHERALYLYKINLIPPCPLALAELVGKNRIIFESHDAFHHASCIVSCIASYIASASHHASHHLESHHALHHALQHASHHAMHHASHHASVILHPSTYRHIKMRLIMHRIMHHTMHLITRCIMHQSCCTPVPMATSKLLINKGSTTSGSGPSRHKSRHTRVFLRPSPRPFPSPTAGGETLPVTPLTHLKPPILPLFFLRPPRCPTPLM